eukprot:8748382-Pyramimonas_sp.AAC.1
MAVALTVTVAVSSERVAHHEGEDDALNAGGVVEGSEVALLEALEPPHEARHGTKRADGVDAHKVGAV